MEERLKEIRDRIDELEREYLFTKDYKLIVTVLDKLGVNEIKLTDEEVSENNSMYMVERDNGKITLRKCND